MEKMEILIFDYSIKEIILDIVSSRGTSTPVNIVKIKVINTYGKRIKCRIFNLYPY